MSKADTPTDELEKVDTHTVREGDGVFMAINFHGTTDVTHGAEYEADIHQAGVHGTVVDSPRDEYYDMLEDGDRIMADFVVETEDGQRFRWQIDNGYVTGYHKDLDRRTDLGHFGGFYK